MDSSQSDCRFVLWINPETRAYEASSVSPGPGWERIEVVPRPDTEAREAEYIRLTTIGKLYLGQQVVADVTKALDLAGFEGEAAEMRHAYEAIESALGQLRGHDG